MKLRTHKNHNSLSIILKTIGVSMLILLALSVVISASQKENRIEPTSEPTPVYTFTQLGQACSAALKNYDAHISDLRNANEQVNASLEKATQAVAGSTDPSITASYNSIATSASNDIAQNNTKISQLSDRHAQVSVCVDKANAQEDLNNLLICAGLIL